MHRILLTLLVTGGLLMLGGCDSGDSDEPGPPADGQGNISVTGAVSSSFSGQAFWSIMDEETDDAMFGIGIIRGPLVGLDPDDFEVVMIAGGATRPGTGTYTLGFEGQHWGVYGRETPTTNTGVFSESGTLEITTSSATRVAGTFSFSGTSFTQAGPGGQATVQGSFDAIYIDPDDLPDDIVIEFRP